jgi:hypothetical protein
VLGRLPLREPARALAVGRDGRLYVTDTARKLSIIDPDQRAAK